MRFTEYFQRCASGITSNQDEKLPNLKKTHLSNYSTEWDAVGLFGVGFDYRLHWVAFPDGSPSASVVSVFWAILLRIIPPVFPPTRPHSIPIWP